MTLGNLALVEQPEQNLGALFFNKIETGLKRSALTTCSNWAEQYRVMGKPYPGLWNFKHHPWLRGMHDSKAELNVGRKAAQMGYTELLLNWTFFNIDIRGESVLYVLPNDDNAGIFSSSRFDAALELSPHLDTMFSDVKNTKHKRAGSANLYIRGSRSKVNLVSVPVGRCAIDELDKMVVEHIPLVWERMSGQLDKQMWMVSTPTVPDFGIDVPYKQSTMEHFFFPCPCCSKQTELTFPESVEIRGKDAFDPSVKESYLICTSCKGKLDHATKTDWLAKGEWVSQNSQATSRGFYINQLYSGTVSPAEIVSQYFKAMINPADEQEFYNSKLGLPHIVEGARVNDSEIKDCSSAYKNGADSSRSHIVTMGVDVGKWLNVEVCEWIPAPVSSDSDMHMNFIPRILFEGKVVDFNELDKFVMKYATNCVVIDANPERRESLKFCARFPGIAYACFYGRDQKSRDTILGSELPTVTVDRTSWMDLAISRFSAKRIKIPMDAEMEYKEHMKAVVKVYEKDDNGNPVAKFMNVGPDHFAHSRTYSEIAFNLAAKTAGYKDIGGIF